MKNHDINGSREHACDLINTSSDTDVNMIINTADKCHQKKDSDVVNYSVTDENMTGNSDYSQNLLFLLPIRE